MVVEDIKMARKFVQRWIYNTYSKTIIISKHSNVSPAIYIFKCTFNLFLLIFPSKMECNNSHKFTVYLKNCGMFYVAMVCREKTRFYKWEFEHVLSILGLSVYVHLNKWSERFCSLEQMIWVLKFTWTNDLLNHLFPYIQRKNKTNIHTCFFNTLSTKWFW